MPQEEILELIRSAKELIRTAKAFGEEEFLVSGAKRAPAVPAPLAPAVPVPQEDVTASSSDRAARFEALYARYQNCQNCPLGRTRKKIVFGVGSLDLKVLVIGEGPGYEEDRQGFPFVGKAGELLDKILAAIGLSRKTNAYIANMVKCHPMRDPSKPEMRGNDRPPDFEEIAACSPILAEQIEILDPPAILALGSTAAKALLKTEAGITRLRGRQHSFSFPISGKTVPLVPTYHPAALLRNPELKKDTWEDVKLLKRIIEGKE